jgi:hypothetical protein
MLNIQDAAINAFTLPGTIFSHFQGLLMLYNLVIDSMNDLRQQYLSSSYASGYMIDFNSFDSEMKRLLNKFESTSPNEFLNSLNLILKMMEGNAFISAYSTKWNLVLNYWIHCGIIYFEPQYYVEGNCNCLTSALCTQPSTPFIPGYLVECTPLESLLESSIECLYDEACIDLITIYSNMSLMSPTPLNKNQTRFSLNDTIESIVEQMFIESSSSKVSYSQFFETYHPLPCSVTLSKRNNMLIVVTTIMGFYGGLTTFFKLVVPFLVSCLYKLLRKYKERPHIQIHASNTDSQTQLSLSNTTQNVHEITDCNIQTEQ